MIRHLFTATGKVTRASFSLHPKGTLKSYALEVLIKRGNGNHGLQGGEDGEGVIKNLKNGRGSKSLFCLNPICTKYEYSL